MTTRKQFLKSTWALAAGAAAAAGAHATSAGVVIRPPGATGGFRDRCTSCGACAEACPERAIVLRPDPLTDKPLPVVIPSSSACAMCVDTPCIAACDDGALAPDPGGAFPRMGVAVVRTDACLAGNGSACMSCYDACPLKRLALKFKRNRPIVDESVCTGCGRCEFVCPAKRKGIAVESI